jgi:hypothetical protein
MVHGLDVGENDKDRATHSSEQSKAVPPKTTKARGMQRRTGVRRPFHGSIAEKGIASRAGLYQLERR